MKKESLTLADKFERVLLKSGIAFGLLLLMLFWGAIPSLILSLFKIDISEMNSLWKVIISFIFDILLLLIIGGIYSKTLIRDFKNYFNKDFSNNLKKSFSIWLLGLGIMIVSNAIIVIITGGEISQNEEAVRNLIDSYPIYMAFQVMIYAPLIEELIFRKSIKDAIPNSNLYIIVSGFIFGGLHVISSLGEPYGFLHLIPYCSLGFLFAYLYKKTDNIFSTITAHSIHNLLALLVYLRGTR